MSSRSHCLRILIGIAAAALLAAACGVNADDTRPAADSPAAVAAEASAPVEPSAALDGEAVVQADPWGMSTRRSIPADSVGTPRKDLETGMPPAVRAALAKSFYSFAETATAAIAPELFAVWGIGAPRGGAGAVEIWGVERDGATRLAAVALPPGGALRGGDAVRIWPGGTAERAWLEVRLEVLGAGDGSGERYGLLLWDGGELIRVFERSISASESAAQLRDLDGDGDPEIVLERSEPELFYAESGIGVGDAAVLRLVGEQFREVRSGAPDATLGAAARGEALAAIDYAEAGLWRMAMERAETAAQLAWNNPQLMWNAIVIGERGAAALRAAARVRLHWLGLLLAGDWGEAVEHFRALPLASQIDIAEALRGTSVAGYESGVAELVRARATRALSAAERLSEEQAAPIYLMRGLARWWLGYGVLPAADDLVEAIAGYAPESIVYDLLWVIGYRGG